MKSRKLRVDRNFIPCTVVDEDELFPNGIFEFNISKIIEYIKENPDEIALEDMVVEDCCINSSTINMLHLDSVDIGRPVIMAEIAPGKYNLIDGHHRMEKARQMGIKKMPAYKLRVDQHMKFLTGEKAYVSYIEYWNGKLKDYGM